MKKIRFIKTKIFVALLIGVFTASILFAIWFTEEQKNIAQKRKDILSSEAQAKTFKEEYNESIQKFKEEYAVAMQEDQQEYEKLLIEQSAIVAQHTSKVPVGTRMVASSPSTTATSKTVTVQKKVAIPKTKTTTKSS